MYKKEPLLVFELFRWASDELFLMPLSNLVLKMALSTLQYISMNKGRGQILQILRANFKTYWS